MSTILPQPSLTLTHPPNPKPHLLLSTLLTSSSSTPTPTPTLSQLKQIHAQILRTGLLQQSPSLLTKLLLCSSSLDYSLSLLRQFPNTQLCNKILRHLSRSPHPEKTLLFYGGLRRKGVVLLDSFSFPPILKACARVSAFGEGREIHGLTVKMGFDSDPFLQTGLVGVYAGCGRVWDARFLFDRMSVRDVVTWSVMLDGYSRAGLHDDTLLLFEEMKSSDVSPDVVVLATVLSACGRSGNLNSGKSIHRYISDTNFVSDSHLHISLITMYASCGSMDVAHHLFDKMPSKNIIASTALISGYSKVGKIKIARSIFDQILEKDLVCWSAMIAGYAESDSPNEAIKLFKEMQNSGIRPDQVTMLSVISACGHLGALDQAKWIHIFVDKNGFGDILSINNAMIDMYSKCGSLDNARLVFDEMTKRNVISWTSMIIGLAMYGEGRLALRVFDQMKRERIEPNEVTFVGVLYACSHAGLVDEGRWIFASMIKEHQIAPMHEHYGCMVDLLGRANCLEEAAELIERMPFEPNIVVWGSLLGACRVHGNVGLGELAAKRLLKIDPDHDGAYVLLSNIYAKANRWGDVGEVRRLMKERGITKERGCSWIELDGEIHEFFMGDESHPKADEIYEKLNEVVDELKVVGYAPNSGSVLVDLEEEEKREAVLLHSEKLALALGLLNGGKGPCIRIVKNLRVCEDCHSFMKWVSKVFEREIVVRDRTRFHHYRNGLCSCKDFW
ncbi:pentatricopeptide repeat (PPR) superfamily protein [Tasmannia lanceolata]|uniref:pentatricopeptide repeat (PPR) superfamily protein n=1 Tax=Tasmannia lanceolata TaxID=3420 RepID=UPI004062AD8C